MPRPGSRSQAVALAAAWLAYFGVLQWSVVRYRVPIVLVLAACTLLLALWQWRGWAVRLGPEAVALALAGSAAAIVVVPLFSYLSDGAVVAASALVASGALACGVLLWPGRLREPPDRRREPPDRRRAARTTAAAALLAALAHAAVAGIAITDDEAPRIDVWVILQQAGEAIARGESFYEVRWTGSPGIHDAFPYLPWTAVLLAPGKWLLGDVRWAMLAWSLVALAGIWALGRGTARWAAAAVIAMVVFVPGGLTQIDQSWTEPMLLAGLVWWAVLVQRGHAWWAVVPLALACASKQHLALLLPVLLVWQPFGARRAVATGALTGALVAPWFLAGPADFVHDTVTLLVNFHAIRFANTLYLLALNTFGVTLPFWLTGVAVLGTLSATMYAVHRRQPGLGPVLRWLALTLLVATMVNKQGFYNQFWLVGCLVAVSLVADAAIRDVPRAPRRRWPRDLRGRPAAPAPPLPGGRPSRS